MTQTIELDYSKNSELFNDTAREWAEAIGSGIKTTQLRKFYDKVLELNDKAKHADEETFKAEILPFVKMLNSKVAYASARTSGGGKLVNETFVDMMNSCIRQVGDKKSLDTFKLFFEAVIGFHKSIEGSKK